MHSGHRPYSNGTHETAAVKPYYPVTTDPAQYSTNILICALTLNNDIFGALAFGSHGTQRQIAPDWSTLPVYLFQQTHVSFTNKRRLPFPVITNHHTRNLFLPFLSAPTLRHGGLHNPVFDVLLVARSIVTYG